MYGKMTTVDVENLLEETASLQVPNTVTMEHTENTGIVAPESITEVPPFEDILPDLLGVGESGEIWQVGEIRCISDGLRADIGGNKKTGKATDARSTRADQGNKQDTYMISLQQLITTMD